MKRIKLDYITKVYGHASLSVKIDNGKVRKVELNVFESSRFFEALVRNKRYDEIAPITSRICGICSASHNITSIMAIENAFNIQVSEQIKKLRELLIYGEWIQSHSLHSYFLALPDYLELPGILEMAKNYKKEVERAFRLKKLGNIIHTTIGGRSIHPLTTGINSFTHIPTKKELKNLVKPLKKGVKDIIETARMFSTLKRPKFERKRKFVALRKAHDYPILHGEICLEDRCITPGFYRQHLKLEKRPYSTSKFITWGGEEFMVGALARVNLNHQFLSKNAKKCLNIMGIELPSYSPFDSNLCRVVEIAHCIDKCLEIIDEIKPRQEKTKFDFSKLEKKIYKGVAITEAPRGILHHGYEINKKGFITNADIITPTAQNLNCIENDVKLFLPSILKKPQNEIVLDLEKLIRSFDPCISCSTHFLEVKFDYK